jgi:hypothetical protein
MGEDSREKSDIVVFVSNSNISSFAMQESKRLWGMKNRSPSGDF